MNTQILKNKIQDDEILNNIASFFPNKIYLVGGSVRDCFLGKDTFDRDLIVTDEDAGIFSQKVAEFFDGKFIPLDEENKIYRVVLKDKKNYLDITNPIENSIEKDLFRRDLTINAIAVDIKSGEILDLVGGVKDIQSKTIRGIKDFNFEDDPLRILRVFRFYSILGFEIDSHLLEVVKNLKDSVLQPAKERIEYELMKLFEGK